MLQEDTMKSADLYLWLEATTPRRKMRDRKLSQNTIVLNQHFLSMVGQEDVYNILVKYRGTFSL